MTAADELMSAATHLRETRVLPYELALADLLEAVSLDPDMEREHDGCDRTICASAAALALARLINPKEQ